MDPKIFVICILSMSFGIATIFLIRNKQEKELLASKMQVVEPPFYMQKAFDAIGIMLAVVFFYGMMEYPPETGSETVLAYARTISPVFVGYVIGTVVRKRRIYFDNKKIMVRRLWRPYQSVVWSEISRVSYWYTGTEEHMAIYNKENVVIAQSTSIYLNYDSFKDFVLKHAPNS